jgi:hypothetical protein
MANYVLTDEWQSLSQIMGEDYDSMKQYRIHNNCELPSKLSLTEEQNVSNSTIGKIYPAYSEIYVQQGLNPSLKVISGLGINFGYNVEISEVE